MAQVSKFKAIQKAWNVLDLPNRSQLVSSLRDRKWWYIDIEINNTSSKLRWNKYIYLSQWTVNIKGQK